jgi:hypothetical protein
VSPDQVDSEVLSKVFKEGVFNNLTGSGFQEGGYLNSSALSAHFDNAGFKQLEVRSIRGIGYKNEKEIINLEKERPGYYAEVMSILHQSASEGPILETSGHAIYVGEKR